MIQAICFYEPEPVLKVSEVLETGLLVLLFGKIFQWKWKLDSYETDQKATLRENTVSWTWCMTFRPWWLTLEAQKQSEMIQLCSYLLLCPSSLAAGQQPFLWDEDDEWAEIWAEFHNSAYIHNRQP